MNQNQFKIAFRNLKKNKRFSIINILGLSLGMSCCFLVILYCHHEFNYDAFHANKDQLYRVEYSIQRGSGLKMGRIPPTFGPTFTDYFPEIEAVSRFYPRALSIERSDTQQQFELQDVFFVDSTVVHVFEFEFLEGNPELALQQPSAVILSDATALRIFGSTNVLGKSLTLAGERGFQVSGVVKAWPDNAHLSFDMLLPFKTMIKVEPPHARESAEWFITNNWTATHSYTYVKLKPNQTAASINAKFPDYLQEKGREGIRDIQRLSLISIQDIHLHSDSGGPKPLGNLDYLYLFLVVGILTLLIACINFINLSTANSMKRAKEVGVRKVLGAQRSALIGQFLGESMLLSFLAFILSLVFTFLAIPYLNDLTGIAISTNAIGHPLILGLFTVIFLATGFLAGLYPAFFVSRFQAVTVLKGGGIQHQKPWNEWLRKGLITAQFLVAIAFITGSLTLYLQVKHLQNQPMGFHQDLVLSLSLNSKNNLNALLRPGDPTLRQRMNTFDERLLNHSGINAVTQCSQLPGLGSISKVIATDSVPASEHLIANVLAVDYDFSETFELALATGRDFDVSFGTDHLDAIMINEKAATFLGWDSAEASIGQRINIEGKEGKIIGVLKDFHFQSLHTAIKPLVLEVRPGAFSYFALRMENNNLQETLGYIESVWKESFPEKVFEYQFLDDTIQEAYASETKLANMIAYAAFLAIFIACFGLFGLAAMVTQQRFKEIGIRKVLGASVLQILQLISKDFMRLIVLAIILAIPLTWYFLKDWLATFTYQIDFPWWAALVGGLVVLVIAFATISAQSIRAAWTNPVDAIRNE